MPRTRCPEYGKYVLVLRPGKTARMGVIIGEGRSKQWWNVRLDGGSAKSMISVSKSFCVLSD